MSLKTNILASYVSQSYVMLIGIVMLPLYVSHMGVEAYGLVGFFTMLQAWFNLLDMGLTPTIARETARFRGGALDPLSYRKFVRALEGVFLFVGVAGGLLLFLLSGLIANSWLKASALSPGEIQAAIQLMAIIVALRWMCGLYRGAISGSEQLVWLGIYNAIIASFRFIGVLPVLIYFSASPVTFFSFQLIVAVLEFAGLALFAYRHFPAAQSDQSLPWSWQPLKPVIKFSLTIAFTSSIWVVVTQTDKLILSNVLSLTDFGYFTLAVLVASGVMVVGVPVGSAIMPRMAKLEAEGAHENLLRVYRQSTQLVVIVAGSVSIILLLYAEPLLWVWTGDELLARQAAPILALYSIGNGVLSVSAFPYYLQYAKGDLRLHLIGNAVYIVLLIPLVIWAARQYGGIGAGYVWLGMNLAVFVIWLPLVHRKFEPGLNWKWYLVDTVSIFIPALLAGYVVYQIFPPADHRGWILAEILFAGMLTLLVSMMASTAARGVGKTFILKIHTKKGL